MIYISLDIYHISRIGLVILFRGSKKQKYRISLLILDGLLSMKILLITVNIVNYIAPFGSIFDFQLDLQDGAFKRLDYAENPIYPPTA